MDVRYSIGDKVYTFTNVYSECGELCGECITQPYYGLVGWLYPDGFQFFGGHPRIAAREIKPQPITDNSYHMWGGELRDKLPHGARYYQRGRRW